MIRRVAVSLFACAGLLATPACNEVNAPPAEAPLVERQLSAADTSGVLRAIHAAEMAHGRLAQDKATDPRVLAFAEKVMSDPAQSEDEVVPRETELSHEMRAAAARQFSRLDAMEGVDFERTYVDEQTRYYEMLVDTFDRELLPHADDPRVRASLKGAREKARQHMREAQALREEITNEAAAEEAGTEAAPAAAEEAEEAEE